LELGTWNLELGTWNLELKWRRMKEILIRIFWLKSEPVLVKGMGFFDFRINERIKRVEKICQYASLTLTIFSF